MNSGRCLIVTGGIIEDYTLLKSYHQAGDFIICADGGARHAGKMGLKPDLLVGDFDTLTENELSEFSAMGAEILRFPREKDFTDTHMALLEGLKRGFKKIIILAALGGRVDHALANVMLLALPEARGIDVRIVDEKQELSLIRKKQAFVGKKGDKLSLLPLSETVKGVNTKGLYYPLVKGSLTMGVPIGISNCFTGEAAEVEVEEGLLLAVRVWEDNKKPLT